MNQKAKKLRGWEACRAKMPLIRWSKNSWNTKRNWQVWLSNKKIKKINWVWGTQCWCSVNCYIIIEITSLKHFIPHTQHLNYCLVCWSKCTEHTAILQHYRSVFWLSLHIRDRINSWHWQNKNSGCNPKTHFLLTFCSRIRTILCSLWLGCRWRPPHSGGWMDGRTAKNDRRFLQ